MKESESDSRELGNDFHGRTVSNSKNEMAHSDNVGTQDDNFDLKKLDNMQKLKVGNTFDNLTKNKIAYEKGAVLLEKKTNKMMSQLKRSQARVG